MYQWGGGGGGGTDLFKQPYYNSVDNVPTTENVFDLDLQFIISQSRLIHRLIMCPEKITSTMHYQPNISITESVVASDVTVNNLPEFFNIQNETSTKHVTIKVTQLHPA